MNLQPARELDPLFLYLAVSGALAVSVATKILPIGLSFAAGAMIFIVADDILPEAHSR
jgi:zinc transporter ZupT